MLQEFHPAALEGTSDGNCKNEIIHTSCYHRHNDSLFGVIEGLRRNDFGNNFVTKGFLMYISAFLGDFPLFLAVVEYGRHVLPRGTTSRAV